MTEKGLEKILERALKNFPFSFIDVTFKKSTTKDQIGCFLKMIEGDKPVMRISKEAIDRLRHVKDNENWKKLPSRTLRVSLATAQFSVYAFIDNLVYFIEKVKIVRMSEND